MNDTDAVLSEGYFLEKYSPVLRNPSRINAFTGGCYDCLSLRPFLTFAAETLFQIEVMQPPTAHILSPNKPGKRFVIVMEILVASVIGVNWVYGCTAHVAQKNVMHCTLFW